jgi:hypothetical protein
MTTSERNGSGAAHALFDGDDVREVLRETFFRSEPVSAAMEPARRPRRAKGPAKAVPKAELPYEVICISMYREDLAALDEKVRDLKTHGHRKMSRSALIRFALAHVDTSALPRSW